MSRSLNRVMLIGHIGKEIDMKYTPSGVAVANFTMATNEQWKDADGNPQERADWHNIVMWRKIAEIAAEYLKKGSKVYIEGKLQTRSYEKDGVKRYVTEVVADQMIMLDGKSEGSGHAEPAQPHSSEAPKEEPDGLPF